MSKNFSIRFQARLESEARFLMRSRLRQVEEIQRLDAIRIYALERKLRALEERFARFEKSFSIDGAPAPGDKEQGRQHVDGVKPIKME